MKIILILLLGILMVGCFPNSSDVMGSENYSLIRVEVVPDSLKQKQTEFIIDVVRAASEHMTGGDYEHPEDVIKQANYTSLEIFAIEKFGLYNCKTGETTLQEKLSTQQLLIYNELRKQ